MSLLMLGEHPWGIVDKLWLVCKEISIPGSETFKVQDAYTVKVHNCSWDLKAIHIRRYQLRHQSNSTLKTIYH